MRLTRKYFAQKFPCASHCANCRFFSSGVTIQDIEESLELYVKRNICIFTDYAFLCQYRPLSVDYSSRDD